jgi:cellulose synthase/poly-beta-1,6-N-acetylglucosamine synthase-like glycosyltransferase
MSGGLSILMPVFNERATIEAAIEDALTAELPVPSRQVVIVDDGSTDGTREFLASATFPDAVTVSTTSETSARAQPCEARSSMRIRSSQRFSTPTSSTTRPTSATSSSRS